MSLSPEHDCHAAADGIELTTHVEEGGKEHQDFPALRKDDRNWAEGAYFYPVMDPDQPDKGSFAEEALHLAEELALLYGKEAFLPVTRLRSPLTCHSERGILRALLLWTRSCPRPSGNTCPAKSFCRHHCRPVHWRAWNTQLTMRTFHIGGTASSTIQKNNYVAQNAGQVQMHHLRSGYKSRRLAAVLGSKSSQLAIVDAQGTPKGRKYSPAQWIAPDGPGWPGSPQGRSAGRMGSLFNEPFVSRCGRQGGVHRHQGRQDRPGKDRRGHPAGFDDPITEYRSANMRPAISILDEEGNVKNLYQPRSQGEAVYPPLPVGSIIMVGTATPSMPATS